MIGQLHLALTITSMLPSPSRGKGPDNILHLLLLMSLLLLFILIPLVEYGVEYSREHIIVTAMTENGVHRDLRDDMKNNRWPAE